MKVQIEIIPLLKIYKQNKFAVLTYQGEDISDYSFDSYEIFDGDKVQFYDKDGNYQSQVYYVKIKEVD
jgi:hypothetical protein